MRAVIHAAYPRERCRGPYGAMLLLLFVPWVCVGQPIPSIENMRRRASRLWASHLAFNDARALPGVRGEKSSQNLRGVLEANMHAVRTRRHVLLGVRLDHRIGLR